MNEFDEAILRVLAQLRTPWLNRAMSDITSLGSMMVISLVTAAAFTVLWTIARDRSGAARIVLAAAGGQLLVQLFKWTLQRPRPTIVPYLTDVTGFSYPSGHALVATATYGTLAWIACNHVVEPSGRRAIRVICWTVVALVAFSRVYLGVHYMSDVISGIVMGIAWLYFAAYFTRQTRPPASSATSSEPS
jgi:undecaprenyl-diphosphatase